jgi:dephospho-CoA kinase
VLVTAPEELKIARFVERSGGGDRAALEAEARRRLAQMIPDRVKAPQCDSILRNDRTLEELRRQVDELWTRLEGERRKQIPAE